MSITRAENIEQPRKREGHGSEPALPIPFSIGDWHVVPELNRLKSKSGDEERLLEPRLVKLLCYLAANRDRVLTRDELGQELWPRVIVNENSLTRAICELRKQLQSAQSSIPNYIETIPKRGYRLLPRVEFTASDSSASDTFDNPSWSPFFALSPLRWGAALSAACVCLIVASWFSLDNMPGLDSGDEAIILVDEMLHAERDFLGGKLQLSTMDGVSVAEINVTPVLSPDAKQYAFIQYDTSGSTIYLGGLSTAIEPVPVYYSNRHLFNLAWSPVGNNLLFAMQATMATAAAYSPINEIAELVMLNLNTLETSRLVEDVNPAETNSTNGLTLS